jgi:hypothetical protein
MMISVALLLASCSTFYHQSMCGQFAAVQIFMMEHEIIIEWIGGKQAEKLVYAIQMGQSQ